MFFFCIFNYSLVILNIILFYCYQVVLYLLCWYIMFLILKPYFSNNIFVKWINKRMKSIWRKKKKKQLKVTH